MSKAFLTILGVVLAILVGVTIVVLRRPAQSKEQSTTATPSDQNSGSPALTDLALLSDPGLITFQRWSSEKGNELSFVVRTSQDQDCPGSGVTLKIVNQGGVGIHEDHFCGIASIYQRDVLRRGTPQLILEGNLGGNENFLQVLAYQNGRVINLTSEIESDFGSHAEIRPQFRSGVRPAAEPYQIMLTQPGLAGSEDKYTSVYRLKDGVYKLSGEFSTTRADDLIEQLMLSSANKTGRPTKR